jgi:methylated-DNA-protein-cysteine methyltransferase-like protein
MKIQILRFLYKRISIFVSFFISSMCAKNDSDFFEWVYQIVRLIPSGRVTTYGAIAKCLGTARSSRMVGWAMNASHVHPDIPAHRVVNRKGMLTGKMHFSSPTEMQERLEAEGVRIENDCVMNFEQVFWDPQTELLD